MMGMKEELKARPMTEKMYKNPREQSMAETRYTVTIFRGLPSLWISVFSQLLSFVMGSEDIFFSFWHICLKNKQASTTHVVILVILKAFHPWFAKSNPSRPRGNHFHAAQYSQGPRTGFENLKCS